MIQITKSYMIPFGLLKVVEFVTLMLSWAIMVTGINYYNDSTLAKYIKTASEAVKTMINTIKNSVKPGDKTSMDTKDISASPLGKAHAFTALCVIAWLFVIVWVIITILKVTDKIKSNKKNIWFSVPHFILGYLVLIAGGLCVWADCPSKLFAIVDLDGLCEKLNGAAAFGIISGFILQFDGILHIVMGQRLEGGATTATTTA